MSFPASFKLILCGIVLVASAPVCGAAPFLLDFSFNMDRVSSSLRLEVPSLPVESGPVPLSWVQDLVIGTLIQPDPPLRLTDITVDNRFESGSLRQFWSFLIENGEGASIRYFQETVGFAPPIATTGLFSAHGREEVHNLFRQGSGGLVDLTGGSSGFITVAVTEVPVPEPGTLGLICLGLLFAGPLAITRAGAGGSIRRGV